MKHFDVLVSQLCEEIDNLKEDVAYWKSQLEEERRLSKYEADARNKQIMKNVSSVLKLALVLEKDSEGNLVIPKKKRTEFINK